MTDNTKNYTKDHCWQYEIRLNNLADDLDISSSLLGVSKKQLLELKVSDLVFTHEPKEKVFKEVKAFIERHEWLGKLSLYPTHFFTARYQGLLCGVVVMDMPVAFSKALGDKTRKMERLISRGASISWAPKNTASALISYSIKWMVDNTSYRYFTAYSDPEAKELGTIYQACNFYYLGQKNGTKFQYLAPNGKWVSDRYFRSRSVYKRLAKSNDIVWQDSWQTGCVLHFDRMPKEVELKIKALSKNLMLSCEKRISAPKHKYAFLLGKTKKETKELTKIFKLRNKIYPFPKNR